MIITDGITRKHNNSAAVGLHQHRTATHQEHQYKRTITTSQHIIRIFFGLTFYALVSLAATPTSSNESDPIPIMDLIMNANGNSSAIVSNDLSPQRSNNDTSALPQEEKKEEGLLVLHIGSSKTGTSSIQCSLQTTPFLAKSSYRYVGRYEHQCTPGRYPIQGEGNRNFQQFSNVAQQMVYVNSTRAKKALKNRLTSIRQSNHTTHAIISAEEFEAMYTRPESFWSTLHDAISPYKGKVNVVITYRHLHELLVSFYYEILANRETHTHWKDKHIISIPEYLATATSIKSKKHKQRWHVNNCPHSASDVIAAYEKHNFTNITVFDFHKRDSGNEDDLIARFICALPHAEEACKAYKNDSALNGVDPAARSRPSHKSHAQFDRIAKGAHSKGMLCNYNLTALSRGSAISAIQNHVEQDLGLTYTDLPLQCPGKEEYETILMLSIQNGRKVWKNAFNEDALRSAFQHYKEKKSFCSVDVDMVLSTEAWSQFIMHDMNNDAKLTVTKEVC